MDINKIANAVNVVRHYENRTVINTEGSELSEVFAAVYVFAEFYEVTLTHTTLESGFMKVVSGQIPWEGKK